MGPTALTTTDSDSSGPTTRPASGEPTTWGNKRWWLAAAVVACLAAIVVTLAAGRLLAVAKPDRPTAVGGALTAGSVVWTWCGAVILGGGFLLVFAPASQRRKALALAWFVPAAIVLLVLAGMILPQLSAVPDWGAEPPAIVWFALSALLVTLVAGGWLTLRGRSGVSYFALVAAPLLSAVGALLSALVEASDQLGVLDSRLRRQLGQFLGFGTDGFHPELDLSLLAVAALVPVVATAWIAAIPARSAARAEPDEISERVHAGPAEAGGEDTGRWRWLALASLLCLAAVCLAIALTRAVNVRATEGQDAVWTWTAWSLGLLALMVLLAPTSVRRKRLSLAWLGPAAASLIVLGAVLVPLVSTSSMTQRAARSAAWFVEVGLAGLLLVLIAGGWLTLRGRTGVSYLALVAAPLLNAAVLSWFLHLDPYGNLHGLGAVLYQGLEPLVGDGYRWLGEVQFMCAPAVLALIPLIATAWIAALPALTAAKKARQS